MRHSAQHEDVVAFREPDMYIASAVRIDAVGVVAVYLHLDLPVRREAGDRHGAHVVAGCVLRPGVVELSPADHVGGRLDGAARERYLFFRDVRRA